MPAVLRAYGDDFDVDAFLAGCTLPVIAVKRRGEPVFPRSQPTGRRHEQSGVHTAVSDADMADFPRQVADAIAFLRAEADQVRRLRAWPGVADVTLDFGVENWDWDVDGPFWCHHLPADLVRLAGGLGLAIELSHYPASPE